MRKTIAMLEHIISQHEYSKEELRNQIEKLKDKLECETFHREDQIRDQKLTICRFISEIDNLRLLLGGYCTNGNPYIRRPNPMELGKHIIELR